VKGTAIDDRRAVVLTAADSSEAWFEVCVTNALSVSFDWKCSCEGLVKGRPWDYLKFSIDGTQQAYICGETAWTNMSFTLNGEGVQTLRWTYLKDEENQDGQDCAWVANIVILFAQGAEWVEMFGVDDSFLNEPVVNFSDVSVAADGTVTVSISVTDGGVARAVSSAKVKDMLEATSNLSDWTNGALAITVEDLTQGVAETVRFRVTFTGGSVPRAFLRVQSDSP
jgi:hypothetical protein